MKKSPDDPEQAWRRKRLNDAVSQAFDDNKAAMGRALGYETGAFIHQLAVGLRPITEKTVRQIEALPGLKNWFDRPDESGLRIKDAAEIAMIMNFRRWVDEQKHAPQQPGAPDPPSSPTPRVMGLVPAPRRLIKGRRMSSQIPAESHRGRKK